MGAYLFDPEPPFAISHVTKHPVVPEVLYDEHGDGGWAWRAMDYCLMPSGLVQSEYDDNIVYLSVGHNDRTTWILTIRVDELVETLDAVETTVLDKSTYKGGDVHF